MCFTLALAYALALASIINYDRKSWLRPLAENAIELFLTGYPSAYTSVSVTCSYNVAPVQPGKSI
jgi:hypothetical protein